MGFCNEASHANMPNLWKDIDSTKTESDLHQVLDKEWNTNSKNINMQYYKIYWLDDLLTAIRK